MKKKGFLKKFGVLAMAAGMSTSMAACNLFGNDTDKKTQLSKPAGISVSCNQETGEDAVLTWNAVANASSYDVSIYDVSIKDRTQIVETQSVTETQAELDESKLVKDGQYTATIIAKGDGTNYTDSKEATYTFTYTYNKDGQLELTQLTMSNMTYNKDTKMLSWAPVSGVRADNSYEIKVTDPSGNELETFYTSDNSLNLAALNLPELKNAGTASGVAKGDGVTTKDSAEKTLKLDNDTKTPRMQAYKTWEAGFKSKIRQTLRNGSFDPAVQEISGVDIADSSTPGKNIITVFCTYIQSGKTHWGKLIYEIDAVEGDIQSQLNEITSKISADNIIEGADGNGFTAIGDKDIKLTTELIERRRPPQGLEEINKVITDNISQMSKTGNNYYISFGGLVDMGGQKWVDVVYNGHLESTSSFTLTNVYQRIASGHGTITLDTLDEYYGMGDFMALKDEYQAWVINQTAMAYNVDVQK